MLSSTLNKDNQEYAKLSNSKHTKYHIYKENEETIDKRTFVYCFIGNIIESIMMEKRSPNLVPVITLATVHKLPTIRGTPIMKELSNIKRIKGYDEELLFELEWRRNRNILNDRKLIVKYDR